jgi:hypothetical protein
LKARFDRSHVSVRCVRHNECRELDPENQLFFAYRQQGAKLEKRLLFLSLLLLSMSRLQKSLARGPFHAIIGRHPDLE